jgi:hypothetical protein
MKERKQMKKQAMLHVQWNKDESATYYIEKDKYSRAYDLGDIITLHAYSGIYSFNKITRKVTRFNGVNSVPVEVLNWKHYTTPEA